ncbi:TlpA family protein disulfide reductase [Flavobacterium aciduliphilum]|uniref:Peroxiredoxin n=1 Tax=Flavobacterium aciduliphilum TaxID=1101402 RepID=A0A328YKY7_9FLAO|nr:TlpA disulfide reductase family protein [Flavobacterium aciduliphilum]RAR72762.1 peroxiredoxin [Flavobacterium aciduliphilum]
MKKLGLLVVVLVWSHVSFGQETVLKFQGAIANKNGATLFIKNNKVIVKEIKLEENGHFSTSFDVKTGMYQLFDGAEYTDVFLKNGFDITLKLDAKNFDESIVYTGKGAPENNYLAEKIRHEGDFNYDDLLASSPDDFSKKITDKQNAEKARLEQGRFDPDFVELQKKAMMQELFELKMYFKQKQEQQKLNNTQAPSFEYENYAGGKTKLEDLRGKYVYIDVWATWCGPCRGEIPFLQKIEEQYHGKNIAFVSISIDTQKDHDKWKNFVKDKSLGGIQLIADKDWYSDFIKAFGIESIPRFILIDPTGKVIHADETRPSEPSLVETLDKLLK